MVGLSFDKSVVEYAPHWLLERLDYEPLDKLIIIAKVLAGIWFARNNKIWEGKIID